MIILEDNERILALLLGHWLLFLPKEIRPHLGISFIMFCLNGLIFPIIHFKYYLAHIEPIYLKPFHMMFGTVSPQSIGLNSVLVVRKILRRGIIILKSSVVFPLH